MNPPALALRHPAGAAVALAAVVGVLLAGCSKGSSGSPGGSGSTASNAASSTSAGTTSSGGSSNSGGSTSVVASNSLPFPIAVGDTWKYNDTNGTTVDRIASVTPVSGGQQVQMDGTITTLGTTSSSTGYFIFHPDGSITYPFNQFNTSSSTTKIALLSGSIMFPSASALAGGQVSHATLKIQVISNGVIKDLTSHITVKGGGTQTVTVPAGTYAASVVDMTMSESIDGITIGTEVMTWFAAGVGPVKSEVILDEAGTNHVEDVNQLTSFTEG